MSKREAAGEFGVLNLSADGHVALRGETSLAALASDGEDVLVSMGVYVIRTRFLVELFARQVRAGRRLHDFARDVLPLALSEGTVAGYRFLDPTGRGPGYRRDVGTIDAYWLANMELLSPRPRLDLNDRAWPWHTRPLQLPPARIAQGTGTSMAVSDTLLSPGCIITNAVVRGSVLSPGVVIEPGAVVDGSVLLPDVVVERGARVRRAVVDQGVRISSGAVVGDVAGDAAQFLVTASHVTLVHATPLAGAAHTAESPKRRNRPVAEKRPGRGGAGSTPWREQSGAWRNSYEELRSGRAEPS